MKEKTKVTVTANAEQLEQLDLMIGFMNEALDPFISLSKHGLLSLILEPALIRLLETLETHGPVANVQQFYNVIGRAVTPESSKGGSNESNV